MNAKIERLEAILLKSDAPVLKYFNPGLKMEYIVAFFEKHNIFPRPELVALYEWHNGVNFPEEGIMQSVIELLPMGVLYSLDQMEKTRQQLIKWNYMENSGDYLPLFGSGEDDLYLLKNSTGEIWYLSPAADNYGRLMVDSIDSLMALIIDCYEERIFSIDSISGLDVDYDKFLFKKDQYSTM